jgi:hypothetical protein
LESSVAPSGDIYISNGGGGSAILSVKFKLSRRKIMQGAITLRDKQGKIVVSDVVKDLQPEDLELSINEIIEAALNCHESHTLIIYIELRNS